ncbi:MAG: serine/threonine-protein kinase [Deltaproteobacteria bacterium]
MTNRASDATTTEMGRTIEMQAAALGPLRDTIEHNPRATIEPSRSGDDSQALEALSVLAALRGDPSRGRRSLEIEHTLGQGGMGVVRLATQVSVGRKVAVKTLREELRSETATLRLLREAWVTGSLEHPNVVPVYDVGLDEHGAPVIILKRIEGVQWGELMADAARVTERFRTRDLLEWNLGILMHVCNAVHFAHSRGIVHRDLKPENVMIGEFGEVYLLDWGIAVSLRDDGTGRLPLARDAKQLAGTPCYMAPEALGMDASPITERTDVYLLGAVLFELLTGKPPHDGDTVLQILASIATGEPDFPETAPPELVRICRRAMVRDPDGRFESAEQFRLAIQGFLQHRDSAMLAADADASFAALRAELGHEGPVVPDRRQRVYNLFGACRFGYREALRIWPSNETARASFREAAITMVDFELGARDARSALLLLGEIEAPPEDLVARAPENAKFARDLSVSYWKFSTLTRDDAQTHWWNKAYSVLASMQARDILAKGDEKYLAEVKAKLGLD